MLSDSDAQELTRAKVSVTVYPHLLGTLSILPPRRRFWDFMPNWVFLRLRNWFTIEATKREVWIAHSMVLRSMYVGLYALQQENLMNEVQSAKEPSDVPPEWLN